MISFVSRNCGWSTALLSAMTVALGGTFLWFGMDAKTAPAPDKPDLAKALTGTWILAGTPDKPEQPPKSGGRLKFFTEKLWCITQADPQTGKVIFHHGGTYKIDGNEYVETVEYANESTADLIGKVHRFKIAVEKDGFTQIGVGNPWDEVWKRAK